MSARQWGLSLFFVGFVALKAAEVWVGIESWPLSNVSMFSDRQPRAVSPLRVRLLGSRGSEWIELRSGDFRLHPDEFGSRLHPGPGLAESCAALLESYNRKPPGGVPLDGAVAVVEVVQRPGLPPAGEPRTIRCEGSAAAATPPATQPPL